MNRVQFIRSIFVLGLLTATAARADVLFVDANVFYKSESLVTSSTTTATKTFYDIAFGYGVDKKDYFQVGWNISGHSSTENSSDVVTTYSSTQMGPIFLFYFGKDRNWRLAAAYNIKTTGNYTAGSATTEKWKGTGISTSLGYQFPMSPNMALGLRMNYSTTSYNESLIDTAYSAVAYKKTLIYPSIAFTFEL